MRISLVYAISAALLLCSSCSRDAPPPAPAVTAPAVKAPATPAAQAPATKEAVFRREELDQMVAPLALYPDPLLAQVLMAATYPGDVADAAAWSQAHPEAKGDDAVRQVGSQPWDPSVQSLVAFPQAMAALGQDPAWVQRLGDAFLAQPDDVMDAVQRLRHQAQAAGNLESNEYQNVSVQAAPAAAPASGCVGYETQQATSSIIVIEPSQPEVVYVPSYDPTTTYGTWAYPSYPPVYYPPPPSYYPVGSALATGIAFGVGLAITDSLWGGLDWNDNDVDINVNRYNNVNVNRQLNANQSSWRHNSINRDGVPYRDRASREQFDRRIDGADGRAQFRGDDGNRAQAREHARASMERRGVDRPATSNREARDRAQAAATQRPQSRDQSRQRAQAATDRSQARDRAASSQRDRANQQATRDRARSSTQDRSRVDSQRHRQSQSNTRARDTARQQSHSRQGPRNNAFEGSSRPNESRSAAQRGRSSQASANRSASSRSAGKQVNRSSRPPQQRQASQRQGGRRG